MPIQLQHFSTAHYGKEHLEATEKNADAVLVINDIRTNAHLKLLSLIMAAAIPAIAVLGAITSRNLLAVIMLGLVLLSSVAFSAEEITTAIDLTDRTISRTLKKGLLTRHSVYAIDVCSAASVQNRNLIIEGYQLPFFSVSLVGKGKHIRIYSTDDAEEAQSVCEAVTGFLSNAEISTQRQQSV
jgi:DNA-binding transcriptional ArsR family regulator